jgi:hypothetical protein
MYHTINEFPKWDSTSLIAYTVTQFLHMYVHGFHNMRSNDWMNILSVILCLSIKTILLWEYDLHANNGCSFVGQLAIIWWGKYVSLEILVTTITHVNTHHCIFHTEPRCKYKIIFLSGNSYLPVHSVFLQVFTPMQTRHVCHGVWCLLNYSDMQSSDVS